MKILNKVDTIDEMRYYLYDTDLEGRDCLTYLFEYSIEEFMGHELISRLIKEVWDSPYKVSGTIFNASSLHMMTLQWRHNKFDVEKKKRFYKNPEICKINCHRF